MTSSISLSFSSSTITKPARAGFIITDGAERVVDLAWETREEAEEHMRSLCWNAKMFAGPFQVEEVTLPPVHRWERQQGPWPLLPA
jgi:hypothetical protein